MLKAAIFCARFRPLSSGEIKDHGSSVSIHRIDDESFNFKDEKDGDSTFNFDKVFYEDSAQANVYEVLASPIVRDAVNAINGTIITYGQTGAGKTYSMEGPGIDKCDDMKKGLIPRVIEGLFEMISSSPEATMYSVKLSMVEIYMEQVRDLFDLSKDNIQIKENKSQGIFPSGVTEIAVLDAADALQILSTGVANRAVRETQMNVASSRSHCVYIITIQHDLPCDKRTKTGKVILVDLAGSESVGRTDTEERLLEEAKTINKSLIALGKVVNALTCSPQNKSNRISNRDSELTRILQDALGDNCRLALLCCCSPSPSNASETLSTLRFGARAQHIKAIPSVATPEEKSSKSIEPTIANKDAVLERILNKLRERMSTEDVESIGKWFIQEGIMFYQSSTKQNCELLKSEYGDGNNVHPGISPDIVEMKILPLLPDSYVVRLNDGMAIWADNTIQRIFPPANFLGMVQEIIGTSDGVVCGLGLGSSLSPYHPWFVVLINPYTEMYTIVPISSIAQPILGFGGEGDAKKIVRIIDEEGIRTVEFYIVSKKTWRKGVQVTQIGNLSPTKHGVLVGNLLCWKIDSLVGAAIIRFDINEEKWVKCIRVDEKMGHVIHTSRYENRLCVVTLQEEVLGIWLFMEDRWCPFLTVDSINEQPVELMFPIAKKGKEIILGVDKNCGLLLYKFDPTDDKPFLSYIEIGAKILQVDLTCFTGSKIEGLRVTSIKAAENTKHKPRKSMKHLNLLFHRQIAGCKGAAAKSIADNTSHTESSENLSAMSQ